MPPRRHHFRQRPGGQSRCGRELLAGRAGPSRHFLPVMVSRWSESPSQPRTICRRQTDMQLVLYNLTTVEQVRAHGIHWAGLMRRSEHPHRPTCFSRAKGPITRSARTRGCRTSFWPPWRDLNSPAGSTRGDGTCHMRGLSTRRWSTRSGQGRWSEWGDQCDFNRGCVRLSGGVGAMHALYSFR